MLYPLFKVHTHKIYLVWHGTLENSTPWAPKMTIHISKKSVETNPTLVKSSQVGLMLDLDQVNLDQV